MSEAKHLAPHKETRSASAHPRYHGLDLLKAVAILAIAAHHFQQDFGVRYEHVNFYEGRFYVGYVVELFFLVSGFVLVTSEAHRSQIAVARPFFRRVRRLWPMAALSVLVATCLWPLYHHFTGLYWDGVPLRLRTFVVSLTTISQGAFFNSYSYNNPLWYVGVLILCYGAFYLLRRLAGALRLPAWPLFLAMCILGAWAQLSQVDVPFLRVNSSARGYAAFFLGVILSLALHHLQPKKHRELAAVLAVLIAAVAFTVMVLSDDALAWEWPIDTFVIWPATILACTLGRGIEWVSNNPFVSLLGRINYELYVWHAVINVAIATVCAALTVPIPTSRLDLLLYLVMCELVATLLYYGAERPLNRILSSRG